jgi:hypothetical protein
MTRTSVTGPWSGEVYVVFQDPDYDGAGAETTMVASDAGADGVAGAVVAAGAAVVAGVVAVAVPEVLVQPAAIIMIQASPARRMNSDFFIRNLQDVASPVNNPAET